MQCNWSLSMKIALLYLPPFIFSNTPILSMCPNIPHPNFIFWLNVWKCLILSFCSYSFPFPSSSEIYPSSLLTQPWAFIKNSSSPMCPAHVFLDVWPPTGAWLIYQGYALITLSLSSYQFPAAISYQVGFVPIFLTILDFVWTELM